MEGMNVEQKIAQLKEMESKDKKDVFKQYLRNTIGKKRKLFGNEYSKTILSRHKFVNQDDYTSFLGYIGDILFRERDINNWYREARKKDKEERASYYASNNVTYKNFIEHGMVGDTYKRLSIAKINVKEQWDCYLKKSIKRKFLIFSNDILFNIAVYAHDIVLEGLAAPGNNFASQNMVFVADINDPDFYALEKREDVIFMHNNDDQRYVDRLKIDNRQSDRIGVIQPFLISRGENGGIRYVDLDELEFDSFIYGAKSVIQPPQNSGEIEKTYYSTVKCDYNPISYSPSYILYQYYMYGNNQNRDINLQAGFLIRYMGSIYACVPGMTVNNEYVYFVGRGVDFVRILFKFFKPEVNFGTEFQIRNLKPVVLFNKRKKEDIKPYSPYYKYDLITEPAVAQSNEALETVVKNRLIKKTYKYNKKYENEIIVFKGKCSNVLQTDICFTTPVDLNVNFKIKISTNYLISKNGNLPGKLRGGININSLTNYITYKIILEKPVLAQVVTDTEAEIGYLYYLRDYIRLFNKLFSVSVKVLKKLTGVIKIGSFKKTLDLLPDIFNLLYYNSIVLNSIIPQNEIMAKIKEYYASTKNSFLTDFINIDFSRFGSCIEYFISSILSVDNISEDDFKTLNSGIFFFYDKIVPSIENERFFNDYRNFNVGTIDGLAERLKGIYNIYLSFNKLTKELGDKCVDIFNKQISDDTLLMNQLSWIIGQMDTIGGVRVNSGGDVIVVDNKKSLIRRKEFLLNEVTGLSNDITVIRNNIGKNLNEVIALLSPKGKSLINLSKINAKQEKLQIYKAIFGRQKDFNDIEDELNETMNTELDFDSEFREARLKKREEIEQKRKEEREKKRKEDEDRRDQ